MEEKMYLVKLAKGAEEIEKFCNEMAEQNYFLITHVWTGTWHVLTFQYVRE